MPRIVRTSCRNGARLLQRRGRRDSLKSISQALACLERLTLDGRLWGYAGVVLCPEDGNAPTVLHVGRVIPVPKQLGTWSMKRGSLQI